MWNAPLRQHGLTEGFRFLGCLDARSERLRRRACILETSWVADLYKIETSWVADLFGCIKIETIYI